LGNCQKEQHAPSSLGNEISTLQSVNMKLRTMCHILDGPLSTVVLRERWKPHKWVLFL